MATTLRGPFTLVPYNADGSALAPLTIDGTEESLGSAWLASLDATPRSAQSFALYDGSGSLFRVGLRPAEPHTDDPDVTAMALDAAGEVLATGHGSGDVRLWNVATGDPIWTHSPADEPIAGVAMLERGPWVLAWSDDGPLLLLDRATGNLITRIEDPQIGPFSVAIAPDESEVACTGVRATRIALPAGELLAQLEDDGDVPPADGAAPADTGVVYLAYLPDDGTMIGVSAGAEADVVFWDRKTGAIEATVALEHGVGACDLAPDGSLAAFASGDEPTRITVVDTKLRTLARTVETGGAGVLDLRFAPDGRGLFVHDEGRGVMVVDATTGEIRETLPESDGAELVIARDDRAIPEEQESAPLMVTRDLDGGVSLTQLVNRAPLAPVGRAVTRDGGRYATVPYATDNDFVVVFDVARGRGLATLAHHGNVQEIWMSPDGNRVAVRAAGHVTVWRMPPSPARRSS